MTHPATHIQVALGEASAVNDGGRWFAVLDWYFTSGAAARLYRLHKAAPQLFVALCYLRDRTTGTATTTIGSLRPFLGVSDSTLYEAKAALLRSSDGLAAEIPPGSWTFRLFPGRTWAGRSGDSGFPEPGPDSRNPVQLPGIPPSHSPPAQKLERDISNARERVFAAFDEWSKASRGFPTTASRNEHRLIDTHLFAFSEKPPDEWERVIRELMAEGTEFKSAKYAIACVSGRFTDGKGIRRESGAGGAGAGPGGGSHGQHRRDAGGEGNPAQGVRLPAALAGLVANGRGSGAGAGRKAAVVKHDRARAG